MGARVVLFLGIFVLTVYGSKCEEQFTKEKLEGKALVAEVAPSIPAASVAEKIPRAIRVFVYSSNMSPYMQQNAVFALEDAYQKYLNTADIVRHCSEVFYSKHSNFLWNVVANFESIYFFSDQYIHLIVDEYGLRTAQFFIFSTRP